MTINTDKFVVPDGAPGGGAQDMKSTQWGETSGVLTNGTISMPSTDGNEGDVITTDGAGALSLAPIPSAGTSPFRASTTTTAPPTSGQVRWNSATQNMATKLFMSKTNSDGTDIGVFLLLSIVPGSRILFQLQTDQSQFQEFDVDVVIDQTTYLEIDVTAIGSNGGNFGNNNNLVSIFLSGTSQVASFATITSTVAIQRESIASRFFKLDASGGAFTVSLPPAAQVIGLGHIFKKIDTSSNAITIDGNGIETIDGEASLLIDSQFDSELIVSDGIGWLRV